MRRQKKLKIKNIDCSFFVSLHLDVVMMVRPLCRQHLHYNVASHAKSLLSTDSSKKKIKNNNKMVSGGIVLP